MAFIADPRECASWIDAWRGAPPKRALRHLGWGLASLLSIRAGCASNGRWPTSMTSEGVTTSIGLIESEIAWRASLAACADHDPT